MNIITTLIIGIVACIIALWVLWRYGFTSEAYRTRCRYKVRRQEYMREAPYRHTHKWNRNTNMDEEYIDPALFKAWTISKITNSKRHSNREKAQAISSLYPL